MGCHAPWVSNPAQAAERLRTVQALARQLLRLGWLAAPRDRPTEACCRPQQVAQPVAGWATASMPSS